MTRLERGERAHPGEWLIGGTRPDGLGLTMGQEPDYAPVSVSFSEFLTGYIDFEETDHEAAFRAGERAGRRLALQLRITADDVDRFIADERHPAQVAGWVRGDALGGPIEVEGGEFNVVVLPDGGRRMDYRLRVHDGAARPLTLVGRKELPVHPDGAAWTLYLRVLSGHVDAESAAPVVATGIAHILPGDFAKQLTTFRVSPPLCLDALERFGAYFAGDLWEAYR
jgi:cholesterol oxidase